MSETAKQELPLESEAEIRDLVQRFESCSLPHNNWTHRAHLAVALCYASQMDYAKALATLRENINTYNVRCGDPHGYSETITRLFLGKVFDSVHKEGERIPVTEQLRNLERACSVEWLYSYYSKARIWSAEARSAWLPPDRKPLDFELPD